MPTDAACYSGVSTDYNEFNLKKVREFGEALMFGKNKSLEIEDNAGSDVCVYGELGLKNPLITWLSQDFNKHSALVKILATEAAVDQMPEPDYVINWSRINEFSSSKFENEITNIINTIHSGQTLFSSDETIALAKQVAAIGENDNDDINTWAAKLAEDIGKGKD